MKTLVEKGLLNSPILFLSHYILHNKSAYYDGLRGVTEKNDWITWIAYILEAIEATAKETREKVNNIRAAMDKAQKLVKNEAPRIYSKDLIEIIFRNPYCKTRFLEQAGLAKRQTAANYLQTLEKIGVLEGVKIGREQYYTNKKLFEILSK